MQHFELPKASRLVAFASGLLLASLPVAASDFAAAVEKQHGGKAWNQKTAVSADIEVHFGGNKVIDGRMLTDTPVGHSRFELENGTTLVFDGEEAWVSPASSEFQGARFHVLTWPYFLAAPMKLDDPGTHLKDLGKRPFQDGKALPAVHLSFGEGVGDSPDDWYVVYRDRRGRLAGMAYIVTFGKSVEEAEKEPHAITYHDFEKIDGVTLPTRWQFWNWNEKEGITGDPIGHAELENIRFVEPTAGAFDRPADARK